MPSLSHFVERTLQREAGADDARRAELLTAWAQEGWPAARMARELGVAAPATSDRVAADLRGLRRRVIASLIVRDATGACGLPEVVSTTTALAELAMQRAVAVHARDLAEVHGVPTSEAGEPQDLLVIGMGKLGGGELNVSSDIDLIFVYDEDGETRPLPGGGDIRPLSNHEFFIRLGRRVIPAISDVTADGYVFRVDMRLRPNGDAGPLAVSSAMLEEYLMVQGREWERFAWLKGRVVSAPVFASAEQFERQARSLADVVRPFVFRKYLDFGAINALRELHGLIRAESSRRNAGREERADNVKLGRGGIREIEFIAQAFQIIRGRARSRPALALDAGNARHARSPGRAAGRDVRPARDVLRVPAQPRARAAVRGRRADARAAARPRGARARRAAARRGERRRDARRVPGRAGLRRRRVRHRVLRADRDRRARRRCRPRGTRRATATTRPWSTTWRSRVSATRPGTAQRLRGVLNGRRVQGASAGARAGIERLLQRALVSAIELSHGSSAAHDIGPDEHFARFAQLAEVIAGRNTYVTLLNQFPHAFERVMRMLAASRWAADYLVLHPILLDELLDERLHEREPDWAAWSALVRRQLDEAEGDQERQMNLLRDVHHAQVFRLLVADLDGRLTVERLADHLSALADFTLGLTLERVWATIAKRHREVPRFAVIGYGKLGGKELGYVSDLDLIFLYDDDHPDAPDVYSVLARRLVTWLTAQTSSGNLFDIDLRLRPNGNAGLMVSSFDAFSRYQRNEDGMGAWVWEHQALTRARHCAGDFELGHRFEAERVHVLTQERDLAKLKSEVLAMRQKMLDGHPNASALFDLKHDRGGMVDIEFIVQYLVLAHAHRHGDLVRNLGNIALLQMAGGMRLIDMALAREVADAYRAFRALQHRLRLNGAERARVEPAEVEAQAAAVRRLWSDVFGAD